MPHLRELVKLYEDKPFALIGVNTGDQPEAFHRGVEKFKVSWITAYQGQATPIAAMYRVRGYPTYILLDENGRIVLTGGSSAALDAPIAELVARLDKSGAE